MPRLPITLDVVVAVLLLVLLELCVGGVGVGGVGSIIFSFFYPLFFLLFFVGVGGVGVVKNGKKNVVVVVLGTKIIKMCDENDDIVFFLWTGNL